MKKGGLLLGVLVLLAPVILLMPILVATGGDEDIPKVESAACTDTVATGDGDTVNVPAEYKDDVKKAAKTAGLPESIVAAQIKQESNWDPKAGSPAGAQGIAQFMPDTWARYGEGGDILNPHDALAAYGRYMKALKDEVKDIAGDDANQLVKLTLAAYNAGPGAVQAAKGVPPFAETENYVKIITGGAQVKYSEGCKAPNGAKAWDGDLGDGEWTTPCPGCQKASGYESRGINGVDAANGNFHYGVDLATPGAGYGDGVEIITPTDMKVVGFYRPDGCVFAVATEGPAFGFGFCHMNRIDVSDGQQLKRGDVVGIEGNKGDSVGSLFITHLHFELYKPGADMNAWYQHKDNIDPEPVLKEKGAWP